jgi:uncharacterized protein (UPF0276 family)
MKRYNKITVGFVVQEYKERNDKMVCSHQYFVAGDEVSREDKIHGETVGVDVTKEVYQLFEMVQPKEPRLFVLVEKSSGGECGEPFETDNSEEALREVLEGMGYKLKEV